MKKIKVWDLPTRLFHWTLFLSVFFMWFSADQGGAWLQWHLRVGVGILVLLIFRLIWGVIGSDTARFTQFVKGPSQIKRYLKNEISEQEQPGHNPLGALMVIALLAALLFQVATGLFSSDNNSYLYNGYLQHLIGSAGSTARMIHITFFNLLLALVCVHIVVVWLYLLIKKHNLIRPMITGIKTIAEPVPQLRFTSSAVALLIVIILALAIYGISRMI